VAIPLPIETERLLLRRFAPERDAESTLATYGDPEVMRFIPGGTYRSLDAVRNRLDRYAREHDAKGFSFWAVVERATGEVVGDAGFGVFRETGDLELGYTLRRDRWGLGYATEAARACLAAGFAHLGATRIVAVVDEENARSARVAERIGMARIGTVESGGRPHTLFATSGSRAPQEEHDQPGQPRDDREDEQPLDHDDREPDRDRHDDRQQDQTHHVH
jgi:[ribosomal protein S5]-alanine N-acetyltransferase